MNTDVSRARVATRITAICMLMAVSCNDCGCLAKLTCPLVSKDWVSDPGNEFSTFYNLNRCHLTPQNSRSFLVSPLVRPTSGFIFSLTLPFLRHCNTSAGSVSPGCSCWFAVLPPKTATAVLANFRNTQHCLCLTYPTPSLAYFDEIAHSDAIVQSCCITSKHTFYVQ
jgi:hypothetical protein